MCQEFKDGFIAALSCSASGCWAPGLLHCTAQSPLGDGLRDSVPTPALPTLSSSKLRVPAWVTLLPRTQPLAPRGSHAAVPRHRPRDLSVPQHQAPGCVRRWAVPGVDSYLHSWVFSLCLCGDTGSVRKYARVQSLVDTGLYTDAYAHLCICHHMYLIELEAGPFFRYGSGL